MFGGYGGGYRDHTYIDVNIFTFVYIIYIYIGSEEAFNFSSENPLFKVPGNVCSEVAKMLLTNSFLAALLWQHPFCCFHRPRKPYLDSEGFAFLLILQSHKIFAVENHLELQVDPTLFVCKESSVPHDHIKLLPELIAH